MWSLPTPPPSLFELSALAAQPLSSSTSGIAESKSRIENTSSPSRLCNSFSSELGLNEKPNPKSLARHVGTWLGLYLACSLALTLHNKHLLDQFPFPWTLTAVHAFSAAAGSWLCAWRGVFRPAPLSHPTTPLLAFFSVLYSANIAASNASLRLVSIATHQVVRAATPLFVIFFAWLRVRRINVSSAKLKSLTPVVLGVVFATYGDYAFTRAGLALTLIGTALAALKTMLAAWVVRAPRTPMPSLLSAEHPTSEVVLPIHRVPESLPHYSRAHARRNSSKRTEDEGYLSSGSGDERPRSVKSIDILPSDSRLETIVETEALHPLDVLFRLSPLACLQCLIVAWGSGEMARLRGLEIAVDGWRVLGFKLAMNGALAFVLNYVSFVASRRAGALSMTVAANIKQVLTVLLALLMFDPHMPSFMHIIGIGLTLAGGIWYGLVEVREKREREDKVDL